MTKNMLKKPLYLLGISLAAVLAGASCGSRPTAAHYVVQGELSDSASHGKTIYLMRLDDRRYLDSTVVEGNRFRFEGTVDTAAYCHINITHSQFASFILEGGDITVFPCLEGCEKPSGTPMNEAYAALQAESDSLVHLITNRREELHGSCLDPQEYQKQWRAVFDSMKTAISQRGIEIFREHADDALGSSLFHSIFVETASLETRVQISQMLGPWLASTRMGKHFKQRIEAEQRTAEGEPFADIAGTDAEGAAAALSDYVGKGNYVLMDIWASWCGPCRGEIPNLRQLHERYGDKGLTVVGIFTYDKLEQLKPTMEEEQIGWPQIADTANVAMDTYGTDGIPFIVLFGPDGTILKRNLRGLGMVEVIDEIMNQNKKSY